MPCRLISFGEFVDLNQSRRPFGDVLSAHGITYDTVGGKCSQSRFLSADLAFVYKALTFYFRSYD